LNFATILKDYDVLHFHDDVDFTFSLFSWFIKRPRIFQCHTLAGTYPRFRTSPIHRAILKKVGNFYITVSNFSRELLINLGVPESRIFVLPNGVDLKRYDQKTSCAKVDDLILFVGRIIRPKGLHVLLESLNYLNKPVSVKIAGPIQDTRYFKELLGSGILQKRGLHDVEWLGCLTQDEMVGWYRRASIFINPSIMDDFGIVNLEALACGTPVIASDSGGMTDIVKNGVNGLLVPPNDPKQLAIALEKLLESEKLREEYGRNGRRLVEEHFSWDMIARKAARIYEKTVGLENFGISHEAN
jgi:glycosyltransferase involved in cell wall biosynthesis